MIAMGAGLLTAFRMAFPARADVRGLAWRYSLTGPFFGAIAFSAILYIFSNGVKLAAFPLMIAVVIMPISYVIGLIPGWLTGSLTGRRIAATGSCSAWRSCAYGAVTSTLIVGAPYVAAAMVDALANGDRFRPLNLLGFAALQAAVGFLGTWPTFALLVEPRTAIAQNLQASERAATGHSV
jgi:hypothetical protein